MTARRVQPSRTKAAATKQADRERRILELWLQRRKNARSGDDILKFYGWLSEHDPDLIPSGPGSYQQVRQILSKHLTDTE